MFRFIHAADIHLDSPLTGLEAYEGAPVQQLRQATRRAFENMVRLAISEEVAFVLIAGDLYDGDWQDYNTGLYFVSQMNRLKEAGIPVFMVAGNHDAQSKITRTLRLPDNAILFSAESAQTHTLPQYDTAIHGQSYKTPSVKKNLIPGYPTPLPGHINIGLLHTCATGREGHAPYAPCTAADLESKGYDYWALGHVHQQETVLAEPLSVFPGNIQGRHIRETGPKGVMLITVDDLGRPSADFRALDVMRWVRIDLDASGLESAHDAVDRFAEALKETAARHEGLPLAARVTLTGTCRAHDQLAGDPERWINEIRSAALDAAQGLVWIEKVQWNTAAPLTGHEEDFSAGPMGELLQYLDQVQEDPIELAALVDSLEGIRGKLPRDLRQGPNAIPLDDPAWIARLMAQVRPMLMKRLMKRGRE
ncbi:MAG: hypothetical protein B5M55_06155 [Desulfococcus sp. 4484_242]|nr:MAG: hypothetical protein B5M55_06155 [Desulfococcus sp. 4484_242]